MTLFRIAVRRDLPASGVARPGPIAVKIRGDGQGSIRPMLADLWPALMTAYVLCLLVS